VATSEQVKARVPVALAEAARAKIGRPSVSPTELVRYALATLAGLDPDEYARHRRAGRPRGAKDLRPRKNARKERQAA
jgi:hypothetical protein